MKARLVSRLAVFVAVTAVLAGLATRADAHVEVSPTGAAPGDAVQFALLVPGERKAHTIEVALKIPQGVLPFSFERQPGWHRQLEKAANGRVAVVRWHGVLPSDGFVRFAFLATTPDREGDLTWKVVQRYDDGADAAWIGPPDSDNPAPVTRISASAPHQNAGGEGSAGQTRPSNGNSRATPDPDGPSRSGNRLSLVFSASGLLLAAAALVIVLRRSPRRHAGPTELP